jgi:hypothetical protein
MIDKKYTIIIGIDPGTKTGLAIWHRDRKVFLAIWTVPIHKAMSSIISYSNIYPGKIFVRFEDARKRTFFKGENMNAKQQGAGSIKRDCSIWQDFLTDENIPYDNPAAGKIKTKYSSDLFKKITGFPGATSNHSRDAAMLVFNM